MGGMAVHARHFASDLRNGIHKELRRSLVALQALLLNLFGGLEMMSSVANRAGGSPFFGVAVLACGEDLQLFRVAMAAEFGRYDCAGELC
jgi:hypothetical protein